MIPSLCQSEEILFICCPWSFEEMENKLRPRREGESGETSCRQDLSFDQLLLRVITAEPQSRRADRKVTTVRSCTICSSTITDQREQSYHAQGDCGFFYTIWLDGMGPEPEHVTCLDMNIEVSATDWSSPLPMTMGVYLTKIFLISIPYNRIQHQGGYSFIPNAL
jgi:hypothetical protein